jgi:DNA polymerase III delta subunit
MEFRDLKKELDENVIQNFYIFVGEEQEVMKKYVKRIDPEAREADSLQSLVVTFQNKGLFSKNVRRTFFIKNDHSIEDKDVKEIFEILKGDRLILIFDKKDDRKKFFKSAKKHIYEFSKFSSVELSRIVMKALDVDERIGMELAKMCNNDVARLESEIDKLRHADKEITEDLIYDLVMKEPEDVIFDMIKAVVKGQKKLAFDLYEDLKERRESPIKIISLLYTQFKLTLLIQCYSKLDNKEIAEKIGINAGRIYYMKELIGAFSLEELKDTLVEIQETEVMIKTGKLDQHTALEKLLLSILR